MSADFWAGYISGAVGIIIGNPLDLIKVRLQAGTTVSPRPQSIAGQFEGLSALVKGASAPVLGYGALNALLFVSYNRTLGLLGEDHLHPSNSWHIWIAGAAGGLATWAVSAPTELVKCRVQMCSGPQSSWSMARGIVRQNGLRGLFWSYELSKQWMKAGDETDAGAATRVLLCGGLAGVVTWASIFPLDVIKTRVQTQEFLVARTQTSHLEQDPLLGRPTSSAVGMEAKRLGALSIARDIYKKDGAGAFFRGLGVCSLRAFVVNAVQWAVYEYLMKQFSPK
ncbi:MAG: hypothetical protein M1817_006776 [Caeruleum heppii]|nr:MAG: hypothetical protein M1817_006776 [Caeruleum heppii]